MPVGIWTIDNDLITRYVRTLRRFDARQIWHTTLDGLPHVETIGSATEVIDVELWVDKTGKEIIDRCQARGEPINVSDGTDTWVGLIAEAPSWEKISKLKGIFAAKISVRCFQPAV